MLPKKFEVDTVNMYFTALCVSKLVCYSKPVAASTVCASINQ